MAIAAKDRQGLGSLKVEKRETHLTLSASDGEREQGRGVRLVSAFWPLPFPAYAAFFVASLASSAVSRVAAISTMRRAFQ